jgi:hypothetical protein
MKIENWNELTEQQKKNAKDQLKIIENFEIEKTNNDTANFFKNNSYVVVKNVIDKNLTDLLYLYVKNSAFRCDFLENNFGENNYNKAVYGSFDDKQSLGDYSKYGDMLFDTLADGLKNNIESILDLKLLTTYSYHRLYTTGSELEIHKDRMSCEISATLCLGFNVENVKEKEYVWPFFVQDTNANKVSINLNPGDLILYRGDKLFHWREPFLGKNHAQVFLHYNVDTEENKIRKYDERPFLGLPKKI